MSNEVKVVVRDPAAVNPEDGQAVLTMAIGGDISLLADDRECVAIFAFFENPPGNQVAVEHSGHEILGVGDKNGSKSLVSQRDASGGGAGGQIRTYTSGASVGPQRSIDKAVADTVCAVGAAYQVYEGGSGNDYDDALVQARTEAGFPP